MSSFPYTDATRRRIKPEPLVFEILWYADDLRVSESGSPAPNRVVGRDFVRCVDLSAAIMKACNMLKRNRGDHNGTACGFYVHSMREATQESREILQSRNGRTTR